MSSKPNVITSLPKDIGPLWSLSPKAIKGEIILAPTSYQWLSYGLHGGSSDNWDEVYVALDLVNLQRSQPTGFDIGSLLSFLQVQMADKRMMQKEFGSWVYLEMHAEPRIVQYAVARLLAARGISGWAEVATGLRSWLRALVGWLAVTGCWGPGKGWGKTVGSTGPGARLLVGKGDYSKRTGAVPYCTMTGKRSWDFKGEWRENVFAPTLLSVLGLGTRSGHGDIIEGTLVFIAAVEGWLGGPLVILTREEEARVLAATRNDVSALQWCVTDLIGDWLPADPFVVVRTEQGVGSVLLLADKSPTAAMQYCGWSQDGTTYAAGADNGLRGAHGEQVENSMAAIDLSARTGYCQRTTGPDRVRVDFPLPSGPLVCVIDAQHGTGLKARWFNHGVETVPPALPSADHGGIDTTRPETQPRKKWRFC